MLLEATARIIAEAPLGKTRPLYAEFQLPERAKLFPLYPLAPFAFLGSLILALLVPWLPKGAEPTQNSKRKRR